MTRESSSASAACGTLDGSKSTSPAFKRISSCVPFSAPIKNRIRPLIRRTNCSLTCSCVVTKQPFCSSTFESMTRAPMMRWRATLSIGRSVGRSVQRYAVARPGALGVDIVPPWLASSARPMPRPRPVPALPSLVGTRVDRSGCIFRPGKLLGRPRLQADAHVDGHARGALRR